MQISLLFSLRVLGEKILFANLFFDGFFNILEGLYGGFTRYGIRHLFGTLHDFLIKHCLLFPHRHLSGTELDSNAREF